MQEKYQRTLPFSHAPIIWPALFYDDASGTFDWQISATAGDYLAEYSTEAVLIGTKSIKLKTRATDPAFGDLVTIYKHLPVPPRKLARIQCAFRLGDGATNGDFRLRPFFYDGTTGYSFEILCLYTDESVQYLDEDNVYQTIPNAFWSKATPVWNSIDLSLNLNNGSYHLLRLNGRTFDLSTYPTRPFAADDTPKFIAALGIKTTIAAWTLFYLDQLLITPETP